MGPTNEPSDKIRSQNAVFNLSFVRVGAEVGIINLVSIFIAVFGGLWLDRVIGTTPIITLVLVLISAPLSITLSVKRARRIVEGIISKPEISRENITSMDNKESTGE